MDLANQSAPSLMTSHTQQWKFPTVNATLSKLTSVYYNKRRAKLKIYISEISQNPNKVKLIGLLSLLNGFNFVETAICEV